MEVASAAQPLIPLATLALTLTQVLKEVKNILKSDKSTSTSSTPPPPIVVVVTCGDTTFTPPPDSDQALLEQLLRERLPDQLDPNCLEIVVQVGAPPPPSFPFDR